MSKLPAALLLSLALAGCASVQMADPKQDAAAKTFTAPAGKAAIYIYRNESMGAAAKLDVLLDGQNIGETAAKTYLYREVSPGKHTVGSKGENLDTVDLDLQAGTVTYVWQEIKMGVFGPRSKLHVVTEQDGRKGVLETKLAVGR